MKSENGRSMVEMLGVLAIIGVLSVGAIAGYSKAMFKYKLNKHAEAVSMLINNALQLKGQLSFNPNTQTCYGNLFKKMNLLPDGIKYKSNCDIRDMWFNGSMSIYYANDDLGNGKHNNFGGIGFSFSPTEEGAEVCRNIVLAAKENAANLWVLETYKYLNDTSSGNAQIIGFLYGDSYCTAWKSCLRDLDLNKTEKLCNDCNERACGLYVLWK